MVGSALGQTLSFTTPPPVASAPTAVTNSASNFLQTGSGGNATFNVTFNSTVNALGNVTRVRYEWAPTTSTSATSCDSLSSSTTITFLDLDDNDAPTLNLILAGGFATTVTFDTTFGDTNSRCYRVLADYPFDEGTPTTVTLADTTTIEGAWVFFKPSSTNPPVANTSEATSITATAATLNGSVEAGGATATNQFCYVSTAPSAGSGVLTGCLGGLRAATPSTLNRDLVANISFAATGLTAGTRYWFQAVATAGDQVSYGNIETFITPGKPIATTNQATNVLSTTATISGTVSANGSETAVTFCLVADSAPSSDKALQADGVMTKCSDGTTLSNTITPTVTTALTANQTAVRSANLTELTGSTKYLFQVIAKNDAGTVGGAVEEFTTTVAAIAPTVVTGNATSVTSNAASLAGTITAGNAPTTSRFCFGTASNLVGCTLVSASPSTVNGNTATAITGQLSGLTPSTTYYYRATGTNSVDTGLGEIETFTTDEAPPEIMFVDPVQSSESAEMLISDGDIRITYGQDFYEHLVELHAPRAKSNGNSVAGSFVQKLKKSNNELEEIAARGVGRSNVLPVGTHLVEVEFTRATGSPTPMAGPQRRIFVDPRPVTLAAPDRSKLKGQDDPDATAIKTTGTFAIDEDATVLGGRDSSGFNVARANAGDPTAEVPGVYANALMPVTNSNDNYDVTKSAGTLFIADLRVRGTQNGQVFQVTTDVVCECETLQPGTVATLTVARSGNGSITPSTTGGFFSFGVFSTMTWFTVASEEDDATTTTTTINDDGNCPLLALQGLDSGDYDVTITGTSPTGEVLVQELSIDVINPTSDDDEGTGGTTGTGTGNGTDEDPQSDSNDATGQTGEGTGDSAAGSNDPDGTSDGETADTPVNSPETETPVTAAPPANLANTGFDSWWLALWASLLLTLGTMTIATNRRR